MSSTGATRSQTGLGNLVAIGIVLTAAIFVVLALRAAAAAHAEFERQRANVIMSESRALCEKWGLPAGTPRFTECLADVQAVRDHQVERIREDDQPL